MVFSLGSQEITCNKSALADSAAARPHERPPTRISTAAKNKIRRQTAESRKFSGIVLDVAAQCRDRAEAQRALRKLCFDRSVGIERVGHALDHTRFEHRH